MRKIVPLILLITVLAAGLMVQGTALGQETPTSTSPPTETVTSSPTSTETTTLTPAPTLTETPTALPTQTLTAPVLETATSTATVETATPTLTGTVVETATATGSVTPTATVETATPTLIPSLTPQPTLTALPTGLTRMFFFQGLAGANVDIYANGLQIGGNIETGRMLGPFALLDSTTTTLLLFPAGTLGQPTLINTLGFEPGSTVLVVAYTGPGGVPTLAVYRLDTAPGQSQLIAINASDAPSIDVVTSSYPAMPLAQGLSAQITVAPGSTASLTDAAGNAVVQNSMAQPVLSQNMAYVQIAVGSVANGTYQVITQAIDLNRLMPVTP